MNVHSQNFQQLENIFKNDVSIEDLQISPQKFAEKHDIQNKKEFVRGVKLAAEIVPKEAYELFKKNPFMKKETKLLFSKMEKTSIDDSKILPMTLTVLALALTAGVVAVKLIKK